MSRYMPDKERKTTRNQVLALFLMLAILFGFGLNRYGLFDVDEAIFAQATIEMRESGDYVTPTYNAEPRYHKPPMIYWLQSFSMEQFGETPLGARLPSAVAAFLLCLAMFLFVDRMTGRGRYALFATGILALNLSFMILARAAIADMVMNFFIFCCTMTLVANVYALKPSVMATWVAGVVFAAGLMTKGPVVALVPTIVVGTAILMNPHGFWHGMKAANPIILIVAILMGLFPWCQMIISAHGPDFFVEFIMKHNVERFFSGLGNTHTSSPYYYLAVVAIGFFPWVLIAPSALWWQLKSFGKNLRSDKLEDVLPALGLIWFVSVVLVFSFSQTKLVHYIVPALPGFALWIAGRLERVSHQPISAWHTLWMLPFVGILFVCFFLLKWLPHALFGEGPAWVLKIFETLRDKAGMEWPVDDPLLQAVLMQNIDIGITGVAIAALLLVGFWAGIRLLNRGYHQGVTLWAVSYAMVLFLFFNMLGPVVYQVQQQPLANHAAYIAEHFEAGDKVYFVGLHQPSVRLLSKVPYTAVHRPVQLENDEKNYQRFFLYDIERRAAMGEHFALLNPYEMCEGGYCLSVVNKGF